MRKAIETAIRMVPEGGIPRTQAPKNICFICNEARDVDSSKYSEGGLGRCEHDRSKETILSCQDFYKSNPTHDYYQASQRLDILLSGTSYAIFSQDVYHHHSCYRRFIKMAKPNKENEEDVITQKDECRSTGFPVQDANKNYP